MTYAEAVERLLALAGELHSLPGQPRRKFDLNHMRVLLAALGDPRQGFRSVLIAGTNGKGSTAAMLASIVGAAGYKVGLYTSPHLERVNERIQFVQDKRTAAISDEDFARHAGRVFEVSRQLVSEGVLPWLPSFFETVTATAMLAFAECKVDLAVLEVGLGGRLDATNVVEPLFSVITDISLDHTEWLGPTIRAITREKAGVLRQGGTLVTLPQHPEANEVLGEVAMELGVRGVSAADYMPFAAGGGQAGAYPVHILSRDVVIRPALRGQHQQRNIALAIASAVELCGYHGYQISAEQIAAGIERADWPGRFERITAAGGREVLLDVAHNPAGAWALRSALSGAEIERGGELKRTLVFSCLADKAVEEMGGILFPVFDLVVLTRIESPRAASLARLTAAAERTGAAYVVCPAPADALAAALEATPAGGQVVIAGSTYLVGELRSRLV